MSYGAAGWEQDIILSYGVFFGRAIVQKLRANQTIWFLFIVGLLLAHAAFFSRALAYDAVDDAYISFRYAQNLARGNGLVFNPGERVEGYTNFLWTVFLVPFIGAGLPAGPTSILLGLAFAVATLWLVIHFPPLVDEMPASSLGLLAAALLAVDGSFVLWSVSGMETAMFAFLVLVGTRAYLLELCHEHRLPCSGLLFAAAAMTRPEGVLWFGLIMIHAGVYRVVAQRRLPTRSDVWRAVVFGIAYGGYFLWRYNYYGYLLPNTFYAKVTLQDTQAQYQRGLEHARAFAGYHLAWITLPLALLALARRRTWWWASCLLLVVTAYVGYIIYVGGDWSVGRFFVPILAPFYLLVSAGIGSVLNLLRRRWPEVEGLRWHVAGGLVLAGLLGLIFWGASIRGEYRHFIQPFDAARATRARTAMGQWLRENVPPGTLIAVDAAGQVPYHSGLPAIDLFGITLPEVAHLRVERMGEGTPGHEKFGLAQVLARRPMYIVIFGNALDGAPEYRRLNVRWTDDPELYSFLSLYRRIE